MATYTVAAAQVGTIIQAGAGTLVSVTMVTAPTGRAEQAFDPIDRVPVAGYLALVDGSTSPRRVLFAMQEDNPALGMRQVAPLAGASFGSLFVSAVPPGGVYTLTTTP
jgi:hypothetical protein